jgi:hypothetical protein
MSITSISITTCSLGLQLFFDLLYLGVKLVPLLLYLQRGLIRLRSACLYDLQPAMQHEHLICVERGSSLIMRTFCGRISSIFFSSLQLWRCSDAGGAMILLDQSSKFT